MFFFLSSISLWVPPQPRHYFSFCVLAVPQTKYLHGPIRTRAEYWELRYHSDLTSSVVLASSFVSVALVHSPNTFCKILTAGIDASSSSCTRRWAPCTAVTKQKRGVTCKSTRSSRVRIDWKQSLAVAKEYQWMAIYHLDEITELTVFTISCCQKTRGRLTMQPEESFSKTWNV